VAVFFSGLALFSSRNVALFALISWVISSRNLSELTYLNDYLFERLGSVVRSRFKLAGSSIMLLIILVMGIYLWQDSRGRHNIMKHQLGWGVAVDSFASADFFLNHGLKGPIFNNYDLGSALIFWLYPQEKVFVDNRPEAYSVKFFQEIYKPMQENAAAWKAQRQAYGFKTIYFSHTDMTPWARTFLRAILQDPDWALVHVDAYTVILVDKKQAEADLLKQAITPLDLRLRLRELQASADNNGRLYLASFAETAGLSDIASEIYHQMLLQDSSDGRVLAALGSLYSVSSDPMYIAQGINYLGRALEAGYRLPGIYNERGLAYFNLHEYQKAATEWRAALKIDKHNTTATSYLEQLSELESQGQIPVLTDN